MTCTELSKVPRKTQLENLKLSEIPDKNSLNINLFQYSFQTEH